VAEFATGKKFVAKLSDVASYLLQDITTVQSVSPSFTGDISSCRASCIFQTRLPGEIAIFKVLQNLVTSDEYKVRSLISDIDPFEAEK
jgi:hypothetical protein